MRENGREVKTDQADRFSRVFDVLELLVGHPEGMTVTEVSKRLDLPTSSTHNLLQRMVGVDVVVVSEDLRYSIGPRAVRLAIRTVDGLEVRSVALRYLEELARETGEDVYLAVRIGRRVVYVERLPGTRTVTVHIRLGQPLYLHATAAGKLFAAHHPQLHQQLLSSPRPRLTERTLVESRPTWNASSATSGPEGTPSAARRRSPASSAWPSRCTTLTARWPRPSTSRRSRLTWNPARSRISSPRRDTPPR